MKKLLFIFLFPLFANSQSKDEIEILKLEVSKYHERYVNTPTIRNDSLLVYENTSYYFSEYDNLKTRLITAGLTDSDAKKILGAEDGSLFDMPIERDTVWTQQNFPELKVKLCENTENRSDYHVFYFSIPLFRNDNKYALILISSNNEGGVLTIYKNTETGWIFHRRIQLYYI